MLAKFHYVWNNRSTLLNSFWAIPFALTLVLISKLRPVKIGPIRSKRIGHFVGEGVEQIAKHQDRKNKEIDIYYFQDLPTCNNFWESKLKEKLPIYFHRIKHVDAWLKYFYGDKYHRPSSVLNNRWKNGLHLESGIEIAFTKKENCEGTNWLKLKNLGTTPYVCLIVRDSEFLSIDKLHKRELDKNPEAYSYHSYRDTNIEDYREGIEWLLSQGVGVLRMGKIMKQKIEINHPKFIDYSFDESRSDFLDYWLFANCIGAISTSTGPDHISLLHKKPILFLNALPLSLFYSFADCIWVPKNLKWKSNNDELNLKEYLNHGFLRTSEYVNANIEIHNLSKKEILMAIKEFYLYKIIGKDYNPEEEALQVLIRSKFTNWDPDKNYHDFINPKCRLGFEWVKSKPSNFLTDG